MERWREGGGGGGGLGRRLNSDLFKVQLSLLRATAVKSDLRTLFTFRFFRKITIILSSSSSHEAFARRGGLYKTVKRLLKQLIKRSGCTQSGTV